VGTPRIGGGAEGGRPATSELDSAGGMRTMVSGGHMIQIGNVPEILAIKQKLEHLQSAGLVREWAVPYENLLTRLDAAIFFLSARDNTSLESIWGAFRETPRFRFEQNSKRTLSGLDWQIQFDAEATQP
jgi:hypothetical protein